MRPAAILYQLAGSPPQDGCVELEAPVRCRVCAAETSRAIAYERWQGSTFTDQNKLRHIAGTMVCEPCAWAHSWTRPPDQPPPPPGKRGVNLRLFSHLYDERGYRSANKADKPAIRAWLCAPKSPPWFCAIADTGQKHVLPWATTNLDPRFGMVRFEERDIFIDCTILETYVNDTCALLTAGATKAEIESGDYRAETWLRCDATLREYEGRYAKERGGDLAALVVWLAQRDEDAVAERLATEKAAKAAKAARAAEGSKKSGRRKTGPDRGSSRRSADGSARGVPRERSERAQTLAADPRQSTARDEDERADGRVGDGAAPAPEPREPEQLGLFGDGGAL